ncbi:MAG: phasin family protein [Gammaproteobacteria bacterium]|nr:phasin family protein [Gammaproteobacteria bacterium]
MNEKVLDPNTYIESFRNALAPVVRAQAEGLKTLDRFARQQYAIAGDCLEYTLAQAKAVVAAKTPNDLLTAQSELGQKLTEQLRARAQEFSTIAAEAQSTLNRFFSEASAKVAEVTKKAA